MFPKQRRRAHWIVCTVCLSILLGCQGFFDDVITSVQVTPSAVVLALGDHLDFAATARMSSGLEKNVTGSAEWSSSSPVVAVDKSGKVIAAGIGTAQISSISNNVSGVSWVIVARPRLISIEVNPADRTVLSGSGEVQYKATGVFEDGTTRDLTSFVNWRSSEEGVSTISAAGVAVPVNPGVTTISASISTKTGAVSDRTRLTVD